jgi:RNA polymerase sigma-70 factor (ECF subfamily)
LKILSFPNVYEGDPAAIRAVVETYLSHILNAARASGLDLQKAEDVTQSTFATFIEKASAFEGRSHVRTWLFGILYRKIAEARRSVQRDGLSEDIDQVMERRFHPNGTWSNPVQPMTVYGTELGKLIAECLDTLPTPQRMAFVFREKEEMPTEEICKILDVSRTNLGVLLYRGRNRLRECLEAKGVD